MRHTLIALSILVLPSLSAQELKKSSGYRKQQLDLPVSSEFSQSKDDDDIPESVIFYGSVYEADAVFFCLDASASQSGPGGWKALQAELDRTIVEFAEDMQFGIIFFGKTVRSFPASKQSVHANEANKKEARAMVQRTQPESWTCMLPGIKDALKMAMTSDKKRRTVILMSDGKPTCQGVNYFEYLEQIGDEVRTLNREKIRIDTIGTGSDVNESFMKQLASNHNGTYRRVR